MIGVVPGRFITLEGGEGAGKSTHARMLREWLESQGISVELTREPGGTPGAEEIRGLLVTGAVGRWDPLTETLLNYAARREHVKLRIQPALAAGAWVICDRFFDSTMAYQGYGQGVDLGAIRRLNTAILGGFAPDLTLILDIAPETRLARTAARDGNEDRFERMDELFHARVRNGFRTLAAAEPDRCVMICAESPLATVGAAVRAAIAERFGLRPSAWPPEAGS